MSFKSIVRELREMKEGIGNRSSKGADRRKWCNRTRSHIAPDITTVPIQQGQWANLPQELLLDIIRRVEESETSWPARSVVVFCASVCKTWRDITKEIVMSPETCGRLTFPISLKQPGPRDYPIQCFIRRERQSSIYRLYFGLMPSEEECEKLLLAAKRIRRATSTDFIISLVADDFSRASNSYVGKLKSNFLGTKFTIYDSQPPPVDGPINHSWLSRRFNTKQVSSRVPVSNYNVATVTYELNPLRTRGPRKLHCVMHKIPISSLQEGGTVPTTASFPQFIDGKSSFFKTVFKGNRCSNPTITTSDDESGDPLVIKNKAPRWHEQLQCWCLNFKGRVTVASVKNFQLAAAVKASSHNIPVAEQEKVILQFGKIGKDIFTMDYRYPLSAFKLLLSA